MPNLSVSHPHRSDTKVSAENHLHHQFLFDERTLVKGLVKVPFHATILSYSVFIFLNAFLMPWFLFTLGNQQKDEKVREGVCTLQRTRGATGRPNRTTSGIERKMFAYASVLL